MDHPPVNALPVGRLVRAGRRGHRRPAPTAACASSCCAPRAAASTPASTSRRCRPPRASPALIGANRGCFAAFAAVYECAVPVIAAVHGFCLGGGIGLVGNARHDHRGRRRHLRAAGGRPRAPSARPPTWPGSSRSTRRGRWCTPRPRPRRPNCTRFGSVQTVVRAGRAPRRRAGVRRAGRREGPAVIRAGQGVTERHRPVGRQAQLPLRAGLHVRAQPGRRGRPGQGRVRRRRGQEGSAMTTTPAPGSGPGSGTGPGAPPRATRSCSTADRARSPSSR